MRSALRRRNQTPFEFNLQLNLHTENTKTFLQDTLEFHSSYTEEHGTEPFSEGNAFNAVGEFMLAGELSKS